MSTLNSWPWAMVSAIVAIAVLCIAVWINFGRPALRRWKLKRPCEAFFHICEQRLGNLEYVVQDDDAHNVREIVLPSNSRIDVEVVYIPKINFHVEETVFGIDGDAAEKPKILERHTKFVLEGRGKNKWVPGVDESESIDRWGNYHFKPRTSKRSINSNYTTGFRIETRSPGQFSVWLGFLTDEIDGEARLNMRVEEKPKARMLCISHKQCYVRSCGPKRL